MYILTIIFVYVKLLELYYYNKIGENKYYYKTNITIDLLRD